MELSTRDIDVHTADGPMPLHVVRPGSPGPRPAVVLLQEAFGVNDHIKDVCRRYADLGFVVVSPGLFHRQGSPVLPYSDIASAKKLIFELTDEQTAEDLRATVEWVRDDPQVDPANIAVVGYCFGGRCAYLGATRLPGLRAVVSYYGGRIATGEPGALVESSDSITAPLLAIYGGQDASIPAHQIAAIERALGAADADHYVITYPEAGHGFCCDARPANYHAESATAAWSLTKTFLTAAFAGDPAPAKTAARQYAQ